MWLDWAEQIGLGELGLMPAQFWALTPHEFGVKFQAFARAENRALWLVGAHAMLTTAYKTKPSSPDRLLGYKRPMERYPYKAWLKPAP